MSQFMKKIFYKQRADFEKDAIQRDQNYSLPEDVIEHKNIYYSNDKQKEHRLDIYYPASKSTSPLPVIINVHGGGLLLGNKEFNRPFCAKLCQAGYLVFSIEYSLIPDCLFYDQCQDLSNAFDFIESLLPQYDGDSSRIYAAGDSGGACLLLYACAMQNDPKLAKAAGIKPSSIPLQALGFISGMFYTNKKDKIGLFLPRYLYGKNYKKTAFAPYISPENPEILSALPPSLLVTSKNDYLQHYTLQFEKALAQNNTPHKLIVFPKNKALTHAFSVFEPQLEESRKAIDVMLHFFEKTTNA